MTRIHVLFIPSSYRSASSCDFSFLILLLLLSAASGRLQLRLHETHDLRGGTWSVLENIKNIHFRNCFAQWQTWQLKVKNNVNFFFVRCCCFSLPCAMRMSSSSPCAVNIFSAAAQYREIADRQGKWERRWQHLTHNNCGMMDHWDKMINDWRQAENVW